MGLRHPGFDLSRAQPAGRRTLPAHDPYLQFPLLIGGQPVTGERMMQPGLEYKDEATDFWTAYARHLPLPMRHPRARTRPAGWDSVPGRPDAKERFFHWLGLCGRWLPRARGPTWRSLRADLFRRSCQKGGRVALCQ